MNVKKNNKGQNLDTEGCRFIEIKFYLLRLIIPTNNDSEKIQRSVLKFWKSLLC